MSEQFVDLRDQPQVLQNLAPQKYGKAAYANLSYTPSKLKETLLYYDVNTMKKDQEKNSKLRQYKAQNQLLQDRLEQTKRQKQGVQSSLNQQISMYKKLLADLQHKYELKIKDLQNQFKQQIQVLILDSEEKSKVVQGQKQRYQDQISLLVQKNQRLQAQLTEAQKNIRQLHDIKDKLHLSQKDITFQLEQAKSLQKIQESKKNQQIKNLKQKLFQAQENSKAQIHRLQVQKQRQLDNVKRQSLTDLSKLEQKAESENLLKNSEIQQITKTFNSEVERLNGQLTQREDTIKQIKNQLAQQKQTKLQMTRAYDKQINTLIFEKNRLVTQLQTSKSNALICIERERALALHPLGLNIQVDKLKQLLHESYNELQRCKQQLLFMDKQRNRLLIQLNRQNSYLQRSRRQYTYRI